MRLTLKKERGAILVMMAIFSIVLIGGFAALALDIGRLMVLRTQMQNAADSAALAAAAELKGELEPNSIENAINAAKYALVHNAHFSIKHDLLSDLPDDAFTFYSWIDSEFDQEMEPPCDPFDEPNKCYAAGYSDAVYVKVRLDPALMVEGEGDYTITNFFLPVLRVLGIESELTSSAVAEAIAGNNKTVCYYPPILICDPSCTDATTCSDDDAFPWAVGTQVVLKEQGPGGTWVPGNFGFLSPPCEALADYLPEEELDCSTASGKLKALAEFLALGTNVGCVPPYVDTVPGNKGKWPMYGINTRFGLYAKPDFQPDVFPPAYNVIDYPRDDDVTSADLNGTEMDFGSGDWLVTESEATYDPKHDPVDFHSTLSVTDYDAAYHNSGQGHPTDVLSSMTRRDMYDWETAMPGRIPVYDPTVKAPVDPDDAFPACDSVSKWDNTNCRILNGNPVEGDPDDAAELGMDDRRILRVAMVNCNAHKINGSETGIPVLQGGGRFAKFFLTEHVMPPSGSEKVNIYAEFLGIEIQKDYVRPVIQLYE